jgi:hypothetical protein
MAAIAGAFQRAGAASAAEVNDKTTGAQQAKQRCCGKVAHTAGRHIYAPRARALLRRPGTLNDCACAQRRHKIDARVPQLGCKAARLAGITTVAQ